MRFAKLIVFICGLCISLSANAESCKEYWRKILPKGMYQYDFGKDSRLTNLGNQGYENYSKRVNRKKCLKEWTVLIYMAADNDLTPFALWDLFEIEAGFKSASSAAASSSKIDVVVQLDTKARSGVRRYHLFETDVKYQTFSKEDFSKRSETQVQSPIVQWFQEDDGKSEAKRLSDFLEWGIRAYPSRHYLVITWGHGQGWTAYKPLHRSRSEFASSGKFKFELNKLDVSLSKRRSRGDEPGLFGGLAFDDSSKSYLDLRSLRNVLEHVSRKVGKKIDVYASDACLMQTVEVIAELSNATRYAIGSNQVQNFLGLPYRRLFYEMNRGILSKSGDQAHALASLIPLLMKRSMHPTKGLQGRIDPDGAKYLLMSAVNSEEIRHQLLPTLYKLSVSIEAYLKEDSRRKDDLEFVIQSTPAFPGSG
ncbi:MAG: clostripain-related cysteine peptidase, partial [Bdellovibrionota bacterium]